MLTAFLSHQRKRHGGTSHPSLQVHRYTVVIVGSFRASFTLSNLNLSFAQSESFVQLQRQRQRTFLGSD